jgi:SAM-dependent methyltransferase
MHDPADEIQLYYSRGEERDRLGLPLGVVEFERTVEIIERHLPLPPAVVADIGGGPGRYSLWLAGLGYTVRHRDLVPLHVEQLSWAAGTKGLNIETALGDARALDLPDASADAVLLLGPLYHLTERSDRLQALREAGRVVKPGGPIYVSAISRWAPRLHGEVADGLGQRFPDIAVQVDLAERSGRLLPLFEGSFAGHCHRPNQLRGEIRGAGLDCIDLVSVEGIAFALGDLDQRMADPAQREVVMSAARAIERVPELLGLGPHLVATAKLPSE